LKKQKTFNPDDSFEFDAVGMEGYSEYKMLRKLKGETDQNL